ncbi:uncharacterized protein N7515_000997 [Penicillium bovifimosum]|uniref:Uncharacterized protein n=1 Tax=Penicillium bovifimosum TaxID=126998 RepID=A0A9W9HGQ6_9EURO|nr:uncharacterized protein N7515_000997 [Penicillium bovifimosum]KAJ5146433.1 hypothetical protein N7515_000997 [Penicillium bovifimosum]
MDDLLPALPPARWQVQEDDQLILACEIKMNKRAAQTKEYNIFLIIRRQGPSDPVKKTPKKVAKRTTRKSKPEGIKEEEVDTVAELIKQEGDALADIKQEVDALEQQVDAFAERVSEPVSEPFSDLMPPELLFRPLTEQQEWEGSWKTIRRVQTPCSGGMRSENGSDTGSDTAPDTLSAKASTCCSRHHPPV